jgi:hypothetical protein
MHHNQSSFKNLILNETTYFCEIPHQSESFEKFIECYKYFASKSIGMCIFQVCLFTLATLCNALVIVLIMLRPIKLTIFDSILIGHCLVNGITSAIDVPLFHLMDLFGYWPLGSLVSRIWVN